MAWCLRGLAMLCTFAAVGCGGHLASSTAARTPGGSAGAIPSGDWLTFDYDAQRDGVGPAETGITAANVGQLILRTVRIDGIADSSAVELSSVPVAGATHDVIVVTTSYGKAIAVDPQTGARLWEFVPPGVNSSPGNPQVTTSTPVIDPDRSAVYSASPDGVVYKLSIATGHEIWARRVTLDPRHEKIASALTISGRYLVVATGGYYGDAPPYDGHLVTIYRSSGRIAYVWNTECSQRHRIIRASSCPDTNTQGDSAIWGRAGAVIVPDSKDILVATGNGPFNGSTNWGDSVLELSPDGSRLLHNWTPTNQHSLDTSDTDVGSASPLLLPTYDGLKLLVQAAKDGQLHLLNLDRLDGTSRHAGGRLGGELDQTSSPGGGQVLTAPAVWAGTGRILVFVADDSGTGAYTLTGGARPHLRAVWEDSTPGTSPVVAGGLLYVYDELDGKLVVRSPASGAALRSLPVPDGHWNSPIVVGGRVILPTGNYHKSSSSTAIEIYHLPGA